MPDMTGLELIEQLRANPVSVQLKAVLFTREINQAMLLKADALNVYQVEQKPTSYWQWREFVQNLSAIDSLLY